MPRVTEKILKLKMNILKKRSTLQIKKVKNIQIADG
jgi:hypothetical protein